MYQTRNQTCAGRKSDSGSSNPIYLFSPKPLIVCVRMLLYDAGRAVQSSLQLALTTPQLGKKFVDSIPGSKSVPVSRVWPVPSAFITHACCRPPNGLWNTIL